MREAVQASHRIKVGLLRRDLETEHFKLGGGVSYRNKAVYTYTKCAYIAIEVHFKPVNARDTPDTIESSPDDVISEVSKAYVDNPVMD